MSAELVVKLVDQATGPAKRVKAATEAVTTAFNRVGDAAQKATGKTSMFWDKAGRLRQANGRFATDAQKAALGIRGIGKASGATNGALAGMIAKGTMVGNVYTKIAEMAGRAAIAIGRFALSLAQSIGKAALFAQKSEMAFSFLTGSKSGGARAFKDARKLAVEYGLGVEQATNSYKKLLAMQFKAGQAKELIRLGADMKALGQDQAGIDGIILAMSQIKSAGRLQGDELNQLAERGIAIDLIYQNLAKSTGKTVKEVIKMKEAGKIPADMAIEAIKAAVKQKFHIKKLGDAAKKANMTVAGSYDMIASKVEDLKIDLAKKLVPILQSTVVPLMQRFLNYLKSDEVTGFIDGLVSGFQSFVAQAKKAVPLVLAFADGVKKGLKDAAPAFEAFGSTFSEIMGDKASRDGLITFFQALGYATASVTANLALAGAAFNKLMQWQMNVWEFMGMIIAKIGSLLGSIKTAATGLGQSFSSGLAGGILKGMSGVISAALSVANAAVSSASGALKINSPSKVMMGIGDKGFAGGMAMGINRGTPMVATASSQMSGAAIKGTSNNISQNVGGATYNISGAQDPQLVADRIAAQQAEQNAKAYEMMMLAAGT